ncbi:PTS lactose/cellobiose transporter subunit IIA [Oceanobacillus sp. 1P07AA]|uniref:PTS lactose/cellobiose transporter subunit IIA n=1 Tax=Oceanobacillus sp. 1P07AA TaxID=3132293 RepID=UPI0039A5A4E3
MDLELEIFQLISKSGDAKAIAYEGLQLAQNGELETARKKLKEAHSTLNLAHNTQTKLIQAEITGENIKMSLLMVHAQDHLMAALSEISLIEEMIKILQRFEKTE